MQEDKSPLEGIVDFLVDWVSDHLPLHLLPSQPEVVVPQFVAGRGRQTIKSKPKSSLFMLLSVTSTSGIQVTS